MATIGSVNLAAFYPVLASGRAMLFSLALVTSAVCMLLLGQVKASRRMKGLVCIALASFTVGEFTMWLRWNGPATQSDGVDIGTYYVAARLVSKSPPKSPYLLDVFPNGKMTFVTPAGVGSAWQRAAVHEGIGLSMQFIYPPLFAVLMKPMAMLPFHTARVVWRILTLMFLCTGVSLTLKTAGVRLRSLEWLYLIVAISTYFPLSDELLLGQVGCFLLFLAAVGVWALARESVGWSAAAFAMVSAIKLTPVVAVPVMAVHRKWRWLLGYGAALLCVTAVSLWQAGWPVHRQFLTDVLPAIACGVPVRDNVSLFATAEEAVLGYVPDGLAHPVPVPETACLLARVVSGIVLGVLLVRVWKRRRASSDVRDVVLMLLATLPLSPISWRHQYTLALLPLLYLWGRDAEEVGNGWLLLTAAAVVSTNVLGFAVALTDEHPYAVALGAVTPLLLLTLVYRELGRTPRGLQDVEADS